MRPDITRVEKVSWDFHQAVTADRAVAQLRRLVVVFSRPLLVDRVAPFVDLAVWVTFVTAGPSSPVRRLQGSARLDGNELHWSLQEDPDRLTALLKEQTGVVVIEVACDYLLDADKNEVSAGLGAFVGVDGGRPGGLFRAFIPVVR